MKKCLTAVLSGLRFRILLLLCGTTFALAAGQAAIDTISRYRQMQADTLSAALDTAKSIARNMESRPELTDRKEIERILARLPGPPSAVLVVDRDLNVRFDIHAGKMPDRGEPLKGALLESLQSGQTATSVSGNLIEVAEPLMSQNRIFGGIRLAVTKPAWAPIFYRSLLGIGVVLAPVLLVAVFLGNGLAGQIAGPLRRFCQQSSDFVEADLDRELEFEGPRELREVGAALNAMVLRVRQKIRHVHELAYVDHVTKLPNREYFRNELSRAIRRAQRRGSAGALLFVDLDGFKKVNDTLGHDRGDQLLSAFSRRVTGIIRVDDTIAWNAVSMVPPAGEHNGQMIARHGGDEFTIVLSEIRAETDAAQVARRIITALQEPFVLDGNEVWLGASVGIATFPRDGTEYPEILKRADMAMYLAKEEGKNTYRFYSDELNRRADARLQVEADLRRALKSDELELHYQPTVDCRTGAAVSLEALIRWNHPEKGMISPGEFIKIAEECGLIRPLGDWVLNRACMDIVAFGKAGCGLPVSVNISAQQFEQHDFTEKVLGTVEYHGVPFDRLELEIAESIAMHNPTRSSEHFHQLKQADIRIAIDDFGTGYSNMTVLTRLPFDTLKIDRSLVAALCEDKDNSQASSTVRLILDMAESLDCQIVAEGVESEAQRDLLRDLGCKYAQGFLFTRPMPASDVMPWLDAFRQVRVEDACAA